MTVGICLSAMTGMSTNDELQLRRLHSMQSEGTRIDLRIRESSIHVGKREILPKSLED